MTDLSAKKLPSESFLDGVGPSSVLNSCNNVKSDSDDERLVGNHYTLHELPDFYLDVNREV